MKYANCVLAMGLMACGAVDAGERVALPLDAGQERLVVALWTGNIAVQPASGNDLIIEADCATTAPEPASEAGGLRSLRAASALPDIVSSDEVISIRSREDGPQCSLALSVPSQLDLHARVNRSGSITIQDWRGRLLAWSADGDVRVTGHSGSLSVTAMNGNALVSLTDSGIDADSAITAANGTLTLIVGQGRVPALRAQARWGDVQTDLQTSFRQVVEAGGTWFVTKRGEGEPVLTLRNLNRDIIVRESQR